LETSYGSAYPTCKGQPASGNGGRLKKSNTSYEQFQGLDIVVTFFLNALKMSFKRFRTGAALKYTMQWNGKGKN
jgi:hypothetical protein